MLGFKGFGFLIALIYNFFSTLSALKEFVLRYAWPYLPFLGKRPEDKLHDVIRRVMLQVSARFCSSSCLMFTVCLTATTLRAHQGEQTEQRLAVVSA